MTKDVYLTITGVQTYEDGYENIIEQKVQGQYYEKRNSRYILYEDVNARTRVKSKNTIKIKDNSLELSRSGSLRPRMHFVAGKTRRTGYATPYGSLPMEIQTDSLKHLWTESTGTIQIDYLLSADDKLIYRNKLSIKITAIQP